MRLRNTFIRKMNGLVGMVLLLLAAASGTVKAGESVSLKVALLPIFDVLPFYVALEKGYFQANGIEIKALPVGSALERDQLLQAGEIDGIVNEITSVANFNRHGIQVKVIGVARSSTPDAPLFRVLAAPGSKVAEPVDLAGVPVGVSVHTIIEYVTDRLLTARGVAAQQVKKQSVPVIPERYQLLLQGQIKAATLPDPLGLSAQHAGAVLIIDDGAYPHYSTSILTFSTTALETKPDAVRCFLKGWDRAAADINAAPESFRALLLKHIRVPPNIRDLVAIPPFPRQRLIDQAQWLDVMDWMMTKGLLDKVLPYADSVTTAFLPNASH